MSIIWRKPSISFSPTAARLSSNPFYIRDIKNQYIFSLARGGEIRKAQQLVAQEFGRLDSGEQARRGLGKGGLYEGLFTYAYKLGTSSPAELLFITWLAKEVNRRYSEHVLSGSKETVDFHNTYICALLAAIWIEQKMLDTSNKPSPAQAEAIADIVAIYALNKEKGSGNDTNYRLVFAFQALKRYQKLASPPELKIKIIEALIRRIGEAESIDHLLDTQLFYRFNVKDWIERGAYEFAWKAGKKRFELISERRRVDCVWENLLIKEPEIDPEVNRAYEIGRRLGLIDE